MNEHYVYVFTDVEQPVFHPAPFGHTPRGTRPSDGGSNQCPTRQTSHTRKHLKHAVCQGSPQGSNKVCVLLHITRMHAP